MLRSPPRTFYPILLRATEQPKLQWEALIDPLLYVSMCQAQC